MHRRHVKPDHPEMPTADLQRFADAASELVRMAENFGCISLTAHSEHGCHRITITKISGRTVEGAGNYQRSGLPR